MRPPAALSGAADGAQTIAAAAMRAVTTEERGPMTRASLSLDEEIGLAREEPAGAPLHDEVLETPRRSGVDVDGERAVDQRLETGAVLARHRDRLGEGHERRGELALGQSHLAIEVLLRPDHGITGGPLPRQLVADEKAVDR